MPIEFRNVTAGPLKALTASAPAGAIIGLIGGKNSGVAELLKLACGVISPERGEVKAGSGSGAWSRSAIPGIWRRPMCWH